MKTKSKPKGLPPSDRTELHNEAVGLATYLRNFHAGWLKEDAHLAKICKRLVRKKTQ